MKRCFENHTSSSRNFLIHTKILLTFLLIISSLIIAWLLLISNHNQPFLNLTRLKGFHIEKINRSEVFLVYHSGGSYIDPVDPKGAKCLIPWTYTDDIRKAKLIMYNVIDNAHAISLPRNPKLRPDQLTCVESMESASNYRIIYDNRHNFNYTMTYSLTSDVPIPYSEFFESNEIPLNLSEKKGHLVCAFISNCKAKNKRLEYVEELMEHIKIDSFGKCLQNAQIPNKFGTNDQYKIKGEILSTYKFTLAFENSDDEDYITEKLYQPLRYGSVPIFRGCANLEDFVPPHSTIDANKFKSAQELAKYLNYLDKNDTAYNEYLQWKYDNNLGPLAKIRFFRDRDEYGVCALVERIHGLWINPFLTDWNRTTKTEPMCNKCLEGFDMSKRRIPHLRSDGLSYEYPLGIYWSGKLNITKR